MPKAKPEITQPTQSKQLPPISLTLSARQQREVTRYAENFGLEPAAVLKQIQARLTPALETEIAEIAANSDTYENARADAERALRAQILGGAPAAKPRPESARPPVTLVGDAGEEPATAGYARTGT